MRNVCAALLVSAVGLGAGGCGGGGGGDTTTPDAGGNADAAPTALCGTPATTLTTYPATFDGSVNGAGADFAIVEGQCLQQHDQTFYGAGGEDQVVELTGLTAGKTYAVTLTTTEDLSFYITSACDAAGPTTDACILNEDATTENESATFTAPAGGHVALIVDTPDGVTPTAGDYNLAVAEVECSVNIDCTAPGLGVCSDNVCVECASAFDCPTSATPACDDTGRCVAGPDQCTGDDANEPDDGPSAAHMLAVPAGAGMTTSQGGSICNTPDFEADWYTFTTTTAQSLGFTLNWAAQDHDLDLLLVDATGTVVKAGRNGDATPEAFQAVELPPGTYFLLITQFSPSAATVATPYTVALAVTECATDFECNAGKPLCSAAGFCGAGTSDCVGDDAGDNGAGGDDGPAAARLITAAATPISASACNSPATEADYYKFTASQGQGFDITATFSDAVATNDIDVAVLDSTGKTIGFSFWQHPAETVKVRTLPAGTYFISVTRFADAASTATLAYSLALTSTGIAGCMTDADCDNEFGTQLFRGTCTAGACGFIATTDGAAGTRCDSGSNCTSGDCSYVPFESDATVSVCTVQCTTTADCADIMGTTCFAELGVCTPACNADLECGANTRSDTFDAGQAWDYATCTVATQTCTFP